MLDCRENLLRLSVFVSTGSNDESKFNYKITNETIFQNTVSLTVKNTLINLSF